jgi:hypothetical protein
MYMFLTVSVCAHVECRNTTEAPTPNPVSRGVPCDMRGGRRGIKCMNGGSYSRLDVGDVVYRADSTVAHGGTCSYRPMKSESLGSLLPRWRRGHACCVPNARADGVGPWGVQPLHATLPPLFTHPLVTHVVPCAARCTWPPTTVASVEEFIAETDTTVTSLQLYASPQFHTLAYAQAHLFPQTAGAVLDSPPHQDAAGAGAGAGQGPTAQGTLPSPRASPKTRRATPSSIGRWVVCEHVPVCARCVCTVRVRLVFT